MRSADAASILEQLMEGIDPETGEILPTNHVCMEPVVMRALHAGIVALGGAAAACDETMYADDTDDAWAHADDEACMRSNEKHDVPHNKNGRPNAGRPWTSADDAELTRLFAQGLPSDELCRRTQRRRRGLEKRLAFLGLAANPSGKHTRQNVGQHWSEREEQQLIDLFADKRPLPEIAAILQRNMGGVRKRLQRLGLIEYDDPFAWRSAALYRAEDVDSEYEALEAHTEGTRPAATDRSSQPITEPSANPIGTLSPKPFASSRESAEQAPRDTPPDSASRQPTREPPLPDWMRKPAEHACLGKAAVFSVQAPNNPRVDDSADDLVPPWTRKTTEELRDCVTQGMTLGQMAEHFGRSVRAIQTRLFYMGIAKSLPFSVAPDGVHPPKNDVSMDNSSASKL